MTGTTTVSLDAKGDSPTCVKTQSEWDTFLTVAAPANGTSNLSTDCDDNTTNGQLANPGITTDTCNDSLDNDCNVATPDIVDADSDGVTCATDCNDDLTATPAGNLQSQLLTEDCANTIDDDCDGQADVLDSDCDSDGDGVLDTVDNCPLVANGATTGGDDANQLNSDSDSDGDACDSDDDDDGFSDTLEGMLGTNPKDIDTDGDGLSDPSEAFGSTSAIDSDSDDDNTCDGTSTVDSGNVKTYNGTTFDLCTGSGSGMTAAATNDGPTLNWRDDLDGDGYGGLDDCNDTNPLVHPGAMELCDGLDNDCDFIGDLLGEFNNDDALSGDSGLRRGIDRDGIFAGLSMNDDVDPLADLASLADSLERGMTLSAWVHAELEISGRWNGGRVDRSASTRDLFSPQGGWQHVVFTWDRASDESVIYIDDEEVFRGAGLALDALEDLAPHTVNDDGWPTNRVGAMDEVQLMSCGVDHEGALGLGR